MGAMMKRRGILAAAGAAVAGILATQTVSKAATPVSYVHLGNGDLDTTLNLAGAATRVTGVGSAVSAFYGVGEGASTHGVVGVSETAYGVIGVSNNASMAAGVYGANFSTAANTHGVIGVSAAGHGVVGVANGDVRRGGVAGIGTNGAYACTFYGDGVITGRLIELVGSVTAGTQSAAIAHPDGSHRLVHAVEAPESWLEDVGSGTLTNGTAQVKLDPDFAAVADMSNYHVFLTFYSADGNGLNVASRSASGFSVREHNKGTSSGQFSWRVMAKRKDIKMGRLPKFAIPPLTPPTIPPPHVPDLLTTPAPKKP